MAKVPVLLQTFITWELKVLVALSFGAHHNVKKCAQRVSPEGILSDPSHSTFESINVGTDSDSMVITGKGRNPLPWDGDAHS